MKIQKRKFSIIIYILLVLTVIACQNTNKIEKVYYDSGELFSEMEVNDNGIKNGFLKNYYKSGKIKAIATYKNNIIIDTTKSYYESGNLKSIIFNVDGVDSSYVFKNDIISKGIVVKGNKTGEWILNDYKNNLKVKKEFYIINDVEKHNRTYTFHKNKLIDSLSNYYSFNLDTISINKEYDLNMFYTSPFIKKSKYVFCYSKELKSDFSNYKKIKYDTLYPDKDNLLRMSIERNKVGTESIRGLIYEMEIEVIENKDGTYNINKNETEIFVNKQIQVID
tara:strand:- start:4944 stop:5780 length:837 start_codon:yes stop_codon:yes gene_type:complete